mgnify:CR=1 FL=1
MKQTIRIIAGQYKGKKLHFPALQGLRPTPDRVRETLFNWLMHDISGARCLDAFAGSGALGFEAFSRGAADVVFLEQAAQAAASLKTNINALGSNRIQVIKTNAFAYLQKTAQQFDIIFLDPPFGKGYLTQCVAVLEHSTVLKDGGLLYIESEQVIPINACHWQQLRLKKAGQVVYALYKKLDKTTVLQPPS